MHPNVKAYFSYANFKMFEVSNDTLRKKSKDLRKLFDVEQSRMCMYVWYVYSFLDSEIVFHI